MRQVRFLDEHPEPAADDREGLLEEGEVRRGIDFIRAHKLEAHPAAEAAAVGGVS